jgi:hypothetical protein
MGSPRNRGKQKNLRGHSIASRSIRVTLEAASTGRDGTKAGLQKRKAKRSSYDFAGDGD